MTLLTMMNRLEFQKRMKITMTAITTAMTAVFRTMTCARVWLQRRGSSTKVTITSCLDHLKQLLIYVHYLTKAQIFRLWQIYLDYVNPLLKVTHTPTL